MIVSLTKIDPANFKLVSPESQEATFTYYTFDWKYRGGVKYWNIVGLRRRSPLLCDLRLLSIEQEMLERAEFEPLHDAYNFVSLNPEELRALIQFFEETMFNGQVWNVPRTMMYLHLMSVEDLVNFHLSPQQAASRVGYYYRYLPEEGVQGIEEIHLQCWGSRLLRRSTNGSGTTLTVYALNACHAYYY